MNHESLMEANLEVLQSFSILQILKQEEQIEKKIKELGISLEELALVQEISSGLERDEFSEYVNKKATDNYIKNIKKLIKYAQMAKGYQDMGNINLQISEDFSQLENEGDNTYEMGTTEIENKA